MNFSAVILAGGQSSRMGRDKAWLEIGGETLLARQIRLVRASGATEVFISGRRDRDDARFGVRVLTDRFPNCGPLAGIESALRVCRESLLLVLAVDMPLMTESLLRELIAQCRDGVGIVPQWAGRWEPLVAFYPQAAAPVAEELLSCTAAASDAAKLGVGHFANCCVQRSLVRCYEVPEGAISAFANWNQPEDVSQ